MAYLLELEADSDLGPELDKQVIAGLVDRLIERERLEDALRVLDDPELQERRWRSTTGYRSDRQLKQLIESYVRRGDSALAIEVLLSRMDPTADRWARRKLGQLDPVRALELLRAAEPDAEARKRRDLLVAQAELLVQLQSSAEASELLHEVLEVTPHDSSALALLAKLDPTEALARRRALAEQYPDEETDNLFGLLMDQGRADEAKALALEVLQERPGDEDMLFQLGYLDPSLALEHRTRLPPPVGGNESAAWDLDNIAESLHREGKVALAVEAARQALRRSEPDQFAGFELLAKLDPAALVAEVEALTMGSIDQDVRARLAQAYFHADRMADACELLRDIAKRSTDGEYYQELAADIEAGKDPY
ncbi:MAG: hypothetical protein P1V81_03895 [Planctomycetota bacterium]|nr:hypothetical protein [Planctomycetota bacterium]